jgi:uncharacterized protein (TIGR02246 family)
MEMSPMTKRFVFLLATALLAGGYWTVSRPKAARADDPVEKNLIQVTEALVAAFNRGDARALSSRWSEKGVYLSHQTGERIKGRKAIEKEYAALFVRRKGARMEIALDTVRLITPEVASLEGTAKVFRGGELPSESTFMMIMVKKDGKWLVDSVREVDLPGSDSNHDRLKELDWLVGEWLLQEGDVQVRTVCAWVANNNFLSRHYTVKVKDLIQHEGTQIVGWDSIEGRIRSWVFDSDGSFGEGTWKPDGQRWTIKVAGVLPGGKRSTSTQVLTKVDDNKYTWQVTARAVDGQLLPNTNEVTMTRQSVNSPSKKEARP